MVVLGTSNELVLYAWVLHRCGAGFNGHARFPWCLLELSSSRAFSSEWTPYEVASWTIDRSSDSSSGLRILNAD